MALAELAARERLEAARNKLLSNAGHTHPGDFLTQARQGTGSLLKPFDLPLPGRIWMPDQKNGKQAERNPLSEFGLKVRSIHIHTGKTIITALQEHASEKVGKQSRARRKKTQDVPVETSTQNSNVEQTEREKIVAIMVGLPGTGKSFYSKKMQEHFREEGYAVETFNVGEYRRRQLGMGSSEAGFFDPLATDSVQLREEIAMQCFSDLTNWLVDKGNIGIFDATNTTRERRTNLRRECKSKNLQFVFIEVVVDDPVILEKLIDAKVRNGVDFKDKPYEQARADFLERRRNYERVYHHLGSQHPNIRIYNQGERMSKNFDRNDKLVNDMFVFLFQTAGNPVIFEENF